MRRWGGKRKRDRNDLARTDASERHDRERLRVGNRNERGPALPGAAPDIHHPPTLFQRRAAFDGFAVGERLVA